MRLKHSVLPDAANNASGQNHKGIQIIIPDKEPVRELRKNQL